MRAKWFYVLLIVLFFMTGATDASPVKFPDKFTGGTNIIATDQTSPAITTIQLIRNSFADKVRYELLLFKKSPFRETLQKSVVEMVVDGELFQIPVKTRMGDKIGNEYCSEIIADLPADVVAKIRQASRVAIKAYTDEGYTRIANISAAGLADFKEAIDGKSIN